MPGSCSGKYHSFSRHAPRALLVGLIAFGFEAAIAIGQSGGNPSAILFPAYSSKKKPRAQAKSAPPVCPAAGLPSPQPSPSISSHKVILTWKASPASKGYTLPVGYCVYRSTAQDAVKKNPTCKQCQGINPAPVVGTTCIDDLVQDQATYYYVVTAVDSNGIPSLPSNQASALIAADQIAPGSPVSTAPVCRGSSPTSTNSSSTK
jgi:hypothetical protein